MMKRLILCLVLLSTTVFAQQRTRIYFNDKGENSSLLYNPYSFLSPKAIENKALRGVVIDRSDLPVSQEYISQLQNLGLEVEMKSRWFNYALVEGELDVESISQLPFVKKVEGAEKYKVQYAEMTEATATTDFAYGIAENQIEMIEGDYLHDLDFTGAGMTIAVIDGGFTGTDVLNGLDSLWNDGRVLGTYNFIDGDTNIFKDGSHGTSVLSILAGYIDSSYVGSAIGANYWLLKSEDQTSETPIEMDYWLAAAEFADSVGADIISSSLGYNVFQGGVGDLSLNDIDGNTALVTIAADMAAQKGLLVVVSAGNEGSDEWGRITAPADGDSVLAIGGVDWYGSYATFSSRGPSADGRIKPDVAAIGQGTAYISSAGPTYGNGTSFSCPLISGMAACLWQQNPALSNMDVFEAIRNSGSQVYTPDNFIGFGIPNFRLASWSIGLEEVEKETAVSVYPNPVKEECVVESSYLNDGESVAFSVINISGEVILQQELKAQQGKLEINTSALPVGSYLLNIQIGDKSLLHKIIK